MTLLDDRPAGGDTDLTELQLGNVLDRVGTPQANIEDEAETAETVDEELEPPVNPMSAALAGFLATAAVGWMLGGIFQGSAPRLIGIAGALIGAGVVALSHRTRNSGTLQILALPIAILAGIGLLVPYAKGTSLPSLVIDAVKAGGLSQPPAPFDPGWRFILIVLCAGIAATATTGAITFNRSRIAVFLPAPLVAAGVLVQPQGHTLLSVAPALALVVGGLAVAFGGELSKDSETGNKFEARRLGKAAGFLLIIVVALFGLSQLGFLYPPTNSSNVIPPKKPQIPPPITNNDPLFTVSQTENTPLRLGVLDVYSGDAWLTPPYDPERYLPVKNGARVPAFAPSRQTPGWSNPQPAPTGKTVTTKITVIKPDASRELPDITGMVSETGAPAGTTFDPRSQTLRGEAESTSGETYTVTAAATPTGSELNADTAADPASVRQFLSVPTAPPAVQAILAAVPKNSTPYERLQYVRSAFFKKVTASGAGNPVDVPPARVQAFLTGTLASPYEITASEVLLARWSGIPARIGYGYYNQDAKADGTPIQIHPDDGALWLEAYFPGYGWTPILGHPAKAQASLNQAKKTNPQILPNGLIATQLIIPIKLPGLSYLYQAVQYFLIRVLAIGVPTGLFFWLLLPWGLKGVRRVRRRRWAERRGPRERIAVAYAEIRDRCIDFNVGHPSLTPLEFLDVLAPDQEHTQLAWLVTRSLWGDLGRDLREVHVESAEMLSRSVFKRLVAGQPFLTRVVAAASRVSLRDPWEATMPTGYWQRGLLTRLRDGLRALRRAVTPGRGLRRRLSAIPGVGVLVVLVLMLFVAGCGPSINLADDSVHPLPTVPASVGNYQFNEDPIGAQQFDALRKISLISNYNFYAIRSDHVAVGTLQTAAFKSGLRSQNRTVRTGVLTSLGGTPMVSRVGGQIFYTERVLALTYVVWFAPNGQSYQLLAASAHLTAPTALFARLIAVEEGRSANSVQIQQGAPPVDSRRSAS